MLGRRCIEIALDQTNLGKKEYYYRQRIKKLGRFKIVSDKTFNSKCYLSLQLLQTSRTSDLGMPKTCLQQQHAEIIKH